MPLQEGQLIGPYQIVGQLGLGGMATVYKAYHARLDRYVAVKMLHQGVSSDPGFLARFEREAQIVARLEHPNIVPVYDFNEFEGQPYLVMKFVEGQNLKQRMVSARLTPAEILSIMTPVADALTYAHQRGVLHRDIKPSNILLADGGMPFLTDFGLARIAEMGATTMSQDMILGTPQYISPEQGEGHKDLDARTDIYSLGIILYEMVAGRVPFQADTPIATVHAHIYRDLPSPRQFDPAVAPAVESVLLKALAKRPADRFTSAVEMVDAYRAALDSGAPAVTGRPAPSFAPPPPPAPPSIPSPMPPAGPRRPVVEARFDASQVDLSNMGRKIEEGARRSADWVTRVATTIEEAVNQAVDEKRGNLSDEERIRRHIKKRDEERVGLAVHATAFVVVNLMFWAMFLSGGGDFPWPLFITFPWGIGMVAHVMDYNTKYGRGAARREQEVQRELERLRAARGEDYEYEKPKNDEDRRYRLSEDGEIEQVVNEVSRRQRRKRR